MSRRWRQAARAADDRQVLGQLCLYITRPTLANDRVQTNAAGQVALHGVLARNAKLRALVVPQEKVSGMSKRVQTLLGYEIMPPFTGLVTHRIRLNCCGRTIWHTRYQLKKLAERLTQIMR